jgi:FkbM family methyltransferase
MINKTLPGFFPLYRKKLLRSMLRGAVSSLPGVRHEAVVDLVRRVSKAVVSCLPKVAHEAILEQICDDFGRFALISRLAPECNVIALKVSGKYGVIQSASNDRAVLMQYAKTGMWAARTNNLLRSFFADKGGNYIDIGANIGLTTIPVAQNPQVSCLAIEPEPQNFTNLCVNIAENCPHKNVHVRRLAIYMRRETLSFELSSGNLGDHRLRTGEKRGRYEEDKRATIDVEATPLDEIAGNLDGPLAVKIDTQGAEPFVVSGGKETLGRAGLIVSEFWPYGMAQLGANSTDFIEFLRDEFATLSIAMDESSMWSNAEVLEEGPFPPARPATEVCEQLSALVALHSDNPEMYVDVLARR